METCFLWNQCRRRQIPERVIRDFFHALNHPKIAPCLDEGFAQLHRIEPMDSPQSPGVKKVEKAVQPPFSGFNV